MFLESNGDEDPCTNTMEVIYEENRFWTALFFYPFICGKEHHEDTDSPNITQTDYGPAGAHYKLDVFYDSRKHQIKGTLSVDFVNNIDKTLNDLHFNLWGNAEIFRQSGGRMKADNIKVNGHKADFTIKETDLHIRGLSLKPEKKATAAMDFTVHIPQKQDRFGWDGTTVSLGNWFPILAVHDRKGWTINPYYDGGDSFYSLNSDFDVTVTTDQSQVIATTGTEVGPAKIEGDQATHRYQALNVRDFAMEMDPTYKVKSDKIGDVKVNVFYKDEHTRFADAMLKYGTESIELFSEKFGAYPWPELDIVTMKGWFGGMEYPQLVMVSVSPQTDQNLLKTVTSHEIGHQWFYGVIGNEIRHFDNKRFHRNHGKNERHGLVRVL
ncbi:M1 family metallopeptidase [Paludifilum halophilum]|uniref:Peptidase M1 membrane alanine aminopeptidase domain-containing protein n=1 Tax=Paludifilum halophilum TaxID=1642702 RepID=A0A235B5Y7_9BACL|nr:M1 family metallopeptidase [Paludifilum halophilum]OYD07641.1 hypothetical protein CHM34_09165 [Paludifilum halophilum]